MRKTLALGVVMLTVLLTGCATLFRDRLSISTQSLTEQSESMKIVAYYPETAYRSVNSELKTLLDIEIAEFKKKISAESTEPKGVYELYADFTLTHATDKVVSVKLSFRAYKDNKLENTKLLTRSYDLASGTALTYEKIFKPESQYLEYFASSLETAAKIKLEPKAENFANFMLEEDSFVLVLNPEQTLSIPYYDMPHIFLPSFTQLLDMYNVCPEPYNPVCGKDRETYANQCVAKYYEEQEILHLGECGTQMESASPKRIEISEYGVKFRGQDYDLKRSHLTMGAIVDKQAFGPLIDGQISDGVSFIEVYTKDDKTTFEDYLAQKFAPTKRSETEYCVVKEDSSRSTDKKIRYVLAPNDALRTKLAQSEKEETAPCGNYGILNDGSIQYFEAQPDANPAKILFVRVTQGEKFFDAESITLLTPEQEKAAAEAKTKAAAEAAAKAEADKAKADAEAAAKPDTDANPDAATPEKTTQDTAQLEAKPEDKK